MVCTSTKPIPLLNNLKDSIPINLELLTLELKAIKSLQERIDLLVSHFYVSLALYYWKVHFQAMKASNNNFLVGFPTKHKAKILMLYAISLKLSLPYDEVELAWLQHTAKPDPFWKEWEHQNS